MARTNAGQLPDSSLGLGHFNNRQIEMTRRFCRLQRRPAALAQCRGDAIAAMVSVSKCWKIAL